MAVEVRDVALEHYSASSVLVRFPNGEKVWLPLSQIGQVPATWAIPSSMCVSRGKHLLITDWIAKQKGFKVTPRELDIDPERAAEKPVVPVQAAKPEALVNGKPFAVAALEQQLERQAQEYAASLRIVRNDLSAARAQVNQAQIEYARSRSELGPFAASSSSRSQRFTAVAKASQGAAPGRRALTKARASV